MDATKTPARNGMEGCGNSTRSSSIDRIRALGSIMFLCDFLCNTPSLMEDVTILKFLSINYSQKAKLKYASLCQNISDHLRALYKWRFSCQQQIHESVSKTRTSVAPDTEEFLCPTVFSFTSLPLANGMTIYNAFLILLLRLRTEIMRPRFDASLSASNLKTDLDYKSLHASESAQNAHAVAAEICKSVKYPLSNKHGSFGAFSLLFPLTLTHQAFKTDSKKGRWLQRVIMKITDMGGFEASRGLTGRKIDRR